MFASIGINLLSAGIFAAIGFVGTRASSKLANKRLWRLSNPRDLTICVAESTPVDTGKYVRRTTGIGQLRALAMISPSLTRAYGRIDTAAIQMASERLGSRVEGDLICLGGAKNNSRTGQILRDLLELGYDIPMMDDSAIVWPGADHPARLEADAQDAEVVKDYGLIIRAPHPLAPASTVIVLAGASTYGSIAAARYFVDNCKLRRNWFAAVVCATIRDDHVCAPELIRLKPMTRPGSR